MAASIKMDELLVSWLGNEAVHENVLSLVEKYREEARSGSGGGSKSPGRKNSSSGEGGDNPAEDESGGGGDDGGGGDEKKTEDAGDSSSGAGAGEGESARTSRSAIPPFYVRPKVRSDGSVGSASSVGSGGPDRVRAWRKKRLGGTAFEGDQTWDGVGIAASASASTKKEGAKDKGEGEGGEEKDEKKETGGDDRGGDPDEAINATRRDSAESPAKEGDAMELTPTTGGEAAALAASDSAAPVPVKEQVRLIYAELGSDPPPLPASSSGSGDSEVLRVETARQKEDRRYLTCENFVRVTKEVCNFPTFFNRPLYKRILELWNGREGKEGGSAAKGEGEEGKADGAEGQGGEGEAEHISYATFRWYWTSEMEDFDPSERFFRLLKDPSRAYIVRDDFLPYVKELLNDHPGLEFLSNHAEFQEKYAVTVITRIFYAVNRCHDGRITLRQVRRSDLLSAFQQVDEEEDINKVTRYFSYEHFYVLYCRFWELDHDRDYRVTREDLLKYGDHCLSHLIVDRIFDAAPRPFESAPPRQGEGGQGQGGDGQGAQAGQGAQGQGGNPPGSAPTSPVGDASNSADSASAKRGGVNREYLSYEDFIFFMLSEEDKANEVSVRYWFSCVDVDGDGRLNNMEMRSFYAVQLHRMQCMGHEIVPFEDMLCQMIDMIKPRNADHFVVEDFLRPECAQVSGALFDALFNLNKYLQFEQRDPFLERQKREDEFETDWDRFACIDYNRLAMEEEAREEEAMEIDWVTVDDEDDDGEDFNSLGLGGASEAPF